MFSKLKIYYGDQLLRTPYLECGEGGGKLGGGSVEGTSNMVAHLRMFLIFRSVHVLALISYLNFRTTSPFRISLLSWVWMTCLKMTN